MKASTKLISLLLLVAMCLSFTATGAVASAEYFGRVTADMMGDGADDAATVTVGDEAAVVPQEEQASVQQNASAPEQAAAPVVIKREGADARFDSLTAALAAAEKGDVIQLNNNFSFTNTLVIDKAVTILLNGHSISVKVSAVNAGIVSSGATLRGGAVVIEASEVEVREGEEPPVYVAGITGSITLDEIRLTYTGPNRMMNAVATVFGGSYSSDPSIYLPEGYKAVLEEGRYVVVEMTEEEKEAARNAEAAEGGEAVEGQEAVEGEEAPKAVEAVEGQEAVEGEDVPEGGEVVEGEKAVEGENAADGASTVEGEETAESGNAVVIGASEQETPTTDVTTVTDAAPAEEQAPAVQEAPAAENKKSDTLVDQFLNLFNTEEEDVDEAAKELPHSEDKYAASGNTEITIGPAPDDVSVSIGEAANYEDAVLSMAAEEEDGLNIVWAKDIDVSGELEEEVTVTITDPIFCTLDESAALYHIVDGVAHEVSFQLDRESGTITFKTSSFSPYAITVTDSMKSGSDHDAAELNVVLGKEAHVGDNNLQKAVTNATTANFTIILDANSNWTINDWGVVTNLEIKMNDHALSSQITVPAGKTLTITATNKINDVTGPIVVNGGNLIIQGNANVFGDITLTNGSLYIDGNLATCSKTITANNSFVQIAHGNHGTLVSNGAGGHITGGTYAAMVPAEMLADGYACMKQTDGNRYVVYQAQNARVKTRDGSINFTRDGGAFVEYWKGANSAYKNYSYKVAVTPAAGLTGITLIDPLGGTTALTGTQYSYTTDNGYVEIPKATLNTLLGSAAPGLGYFRFTINGETIDMPVMIHPEVTWTPTTYIVDSFEPVVITVTDHGGAADEPVRMTIDCDVDGNAFDHPFTAYTLSGNDYTLSTSYLNTLAPGNHVIDLWYNMGNGKLERQRCTISVYKDYKVTEINGVNMYKDKNQPDVNWYQYSGKNLNFTANGDPNRFLGVKIDGKLINAGNYAVYKDAANGTTTVGLYPGYLATLAQGKHTIALVFTDGEATATFSVLGASASPKTGDNNHIGLWAGLLVFSGAAVVALIPKKKKQ